MRVRLSFEVSPEHHRALTNRIWRRDLLVTKDGLATEACIRQWARDLIYDRIDDEARVDECVRLDCADTDEDHEHWDGSDVPVPKGYE